MTYKAAVAGLNLGGGKSVIIGDNKRTDREALFRAHGRFVESLGGRYITAEDVGTSRRATWNSSSCETKHVAGLLGLSGDPSPVTALRRVRRHEGRGQGAVGQGLARRQDGRGAGLPARWPTT